MAGVCLVLLVSWWLSIGFGEYLSGGNVEGASGTFGCAVYPRPVTVIVR
jgi:hypothetical protein